MSESKDKTSMGLEPNLAGLLCYVVGWVTGLIFFILEKDNQFVRFHAMQSIVVFGVLTVISIILSFIPVIGWILGWLLGVLGFILWIILMLKAYKGERYKLPWAGNFAEKQLKAGTSNKP
ncbi:DUF4870 domain-containing protein [Chloroflexota bacterium]